VTYLFMKYDSKIYVWIRVFPYICIEIMKTSVGYIFSTNLSIIRLKVGLQNALV
jgi:hypothetical protein